MQICIESDCTNKHHCKGLCKLHYSRIWDRNHKAQASHSAKKRLSIMKTKVFGYYSNFTFRCNCCSVTGFEFLTIDHIDGKKSVKHGMDMKGKKLYSWLIRNGFPDGYQVLCWNCNSAKGIYGICPHKQK